MQEESKLYNQVKKFLEGCQERGDPLYFEHRSGSGGYNYKKGIPDLFIVVNSVHIEVELKTPTGHLSTQQEKWKWKCEHLWGMLYVCPRTLKELQEFLEPFLFDRG